MDHVIDYKKIPEDIRTAFHFVEMAVSIRASADGYWGLEISGGNAVTIETKLRRAGYPAFAGKHDWITLRAIKKEEIVLFDQEDQEVLKRANPSDDGSVFGRIIDGLKE